MVYREKLNVEDNLQREEKDLKIEFNTILTGCCQPN